MAQLEKFIKVTQEQYNTLANGGTVGSYTGIDPNFIYLVEGSEGGTTVISNPTLSGSETVLTGLAINGINYRMPDIIVDETYVSDAFSNFMADEVEPKLDDKQETLVSGTNIKTINNQSLLGSGNITIAGGSGSGSGSAGSLIIEKALTIDTLNQIYLTLTEDEYTQLVGDPNGIIKASLEGETLFFRQLLPVTRIDQIDGNIIPTLKFYSELIIEDIDGITKEYYVLSVSSEDPSKYYLSTQKHMLNDAEFIEAGFVMLYSSVLMTDIDGKTGTLSYEDYERLLWSYDSSLGTDFKLRYHPVVRDPDGGNNLIFYKVGGYTIDKWFAIDSVGNTYILTVNSDRTWSIAKQKIAFDDSWATLDCSWTPSAESTFLTTTGSMGRSSDGTANVVTLTINTGVQDYHGYPQLLVRNFSPSTSHATPAAAAPTFMLAETGAGTSTGKQLELFYSPTWATESTSLFTDTTTENLFNTTQLTSARWYSLGAITIPQDQWRGKKSLSGLTIQANLTDNFGLTSATGSNLSINNVISFKLPAAGNKCIWQGVTPEFEMYQGMAAIDNVSISSLPSGKVYKKINMGSSYSWTASSSDLVIKNPVCFKLMHAFGPEAGLANSTNNSKYYNYQYEATGSARLQNDWIRVTCNVDEDTVDLANTKIMSATNISIQLQR